MSRWTELRDKLRGIGVEPKSIMISAGDQSRLMAENTRKQWEEYQRQMTGISPWTTGTSTSPPKPTSITISLETFQKMQIESGKELLSALSVMMRMEGIDVAEADKITIEIGDEVKVSAIPAPVKYTVKVDTDGYVSGFDSGYAKAAQYMADNMDKLILDSIRNENKS